LNGASSEIGLATASAFAGAGAGLALADINVDAFQIATNTLGAAGHYVLGNVRRGR
jgi:NADP-dependent 3-hydroxy acid dehydrogenase YdfG